MPAAIALDATYSLGRNLTGVGVYCREILHGVAAASPQQRFLACYRSHRIVQAFREPLPPNCSRRLLSEFSVPRRAALFHGLNQRMPEFRFKRACVTVHDLFVMTGEYSTPEFRARFTAQARLAAANSDLVICVSRFTADAVESLLGVAASRIRVIHHGVRTFANQATPKREPTVLHVGALQKRKNLVRLIEAFEKAAPEPWRLVLAGSDGYGAEEIHARIAQSPARTRIQTTGYVSNEEIDRLYVTAGIFAFPSLDEGFGMPVLEAMGHGTPVMAARRSALPEVCGEAALLVNPLDVEEMSCGLRRLITDESLYNRYSLLGRERAAVFSWTQAAEQTLSVYRELAD